METTATAIILFEKAVCFLDKLLIRNSAKTQLKRASEMLPRARKLNRRESPMKMELFRATAASTVRTIAIRKDLPREVANPQ
ncbi:hypothetical protein [Leptolyngbya sp. ST-U4]|uniref:hypothetical protein n=1 Tax=Leptolyngbya sp. ST-U4 TaxID=2933912 RepID=UPI0019BBD4F3|nr:hypothetical protein [Cyanobacteria bacterium FACHB-502]